MAKKDKEPEAEAEGEKPEGEGARSRAEERLLASFSATKKMLMIAVPVLVAGAGRRRRGRLLLPVQEAATTPSEAKAEEVPLTPPKVAFSDMPDILVNIQSNDGTPAYLKLSRVAGTGQ